MVSMAKSITEIQPKIDALRATGCNVEHNRADGTLRVVDPDGNVVLSGLQKGPGGSWILRWTSSNIVTWK